MLEYHPSLGVASKLPQALSHAYWELYNLHKPKSVTDMIEMERKVLEIAITRWETMPTAGDGYAPQVQKEVCQTQHLMLSS